MDSQIRNSSVSASTNISRINHKAAVIPSVFRVFFSPYFIVAFDNNLSVFYSVGFAWNANHMKCQSRFPTGSSYGNELNVWTGSLLAFSIEKSKEYAIRANQSTIRQRPSTTTHRRERLSLRSIRSRTLHTSGNINSLNWLLFSDQCWFHAQIRCQTLHISHCTYNVYTSIEDWVFVLVVCVPPVWMWSSFVTEWRHAVCFQWNDSCAVWIERHFVAFCECVCVRAVIVDPKHSSRAEGSVADALNSCCGATLIFPICRSPETAPTTTK